MNLTEKERNVINAMRGESNGIDNDTTGREKMIDRYMKMDDYDSFMSMLKPLVTIQFSRCFKIL